jgi:hypothetical protein
MIVFGNQKQREGHENHPRVILNRFHIFYCYGLQFRRHMEADLLNLREFLSRMWSPRNLSACISCYFAFSKNPLKKIFLRT